MRWGQIEEGEEGMGKSERARNSVLLKSLEKEVRELQVSTLLESGVGLETTGCMRMYAVSIVALLLYCRAASLVSRCCFNVSTFRTLRRLAMRKPQTNA